MKREAPQNLRPLIVVPLFTFVIGLATGLHMPGALALAAGFGLPLAAMIFGLRFLQKRVRLRSFLLNALLHTLFYFAVLTAAFVIQFSILDALSIGPQRSSARSLEWIGAHFSLFIWIYLGFLVWLYFVISIRALSKKLGKGVLWNWIRGYYHRPRTEEHVVMFLDLQGSTALAERLGDERFSSLIREFFSDLSTPLQRCGGQVSHYIGDEAVLTWRTTGRLVLAQPVQLFFFFDRLLADRADHYRETYGIAPTFKAGAHVGPVVVTEVGDVRSEFVLHGDVLNVASRIQGLCGGLGERLLISQELADRLRPEAWFRVRGKGKVPLRGKSDEMPLCAVDLTQ